MIFGNTVTLLSCVRGNVKVRIKNWSDGLRDAEGKKSKREPFWPEQMSEGRCSYSVPWSRTVTRGTRFLRATETVETAKGFLSAISFSAQLLTRKDETGNSQTYAYLISHTGTVSSRLNRKAPIPISLHVQHRRETTNTTDDFNDRPQSLAWRHTEHVYVQLFCTSYSNPSGK